MPWSLPVSPTSSSNPSSGPKHTELVVVFKTCPFTSLCGQCCLLFLECSLPCLPSDCHLCILQGSPFLWGSEVLLAGLLSLFCAIIAPWLWLRDTFYFLECTPLPPPPIFCILLLIIQDSPLTPLFPIVRVDLSSLYLSVIVLSCIWLVLVAGMFWLAFGLIVNHFRIGS